MYVRPVSGYWISDDFAAHHARNSDEPGVDYAAPRGTPVYAMSNGRVRTVKTDTSGAMGRRVIIEYDDGHWSDYIHLDSINVSWGDRVAAGQQVGTLGGSGYGSNSGVGYHVHVSFWRPGSHPENRWGSGIDVEAFLRQQGAGPAAVIRVNRPVKDVQNAIGTAADGEWGPASDRDLRAWQKSNGLTVDGIWGPKSDATAFGTSSGNVSLEQQFEEDDMGQYVSADGNRTIYWWSPAKRRVTKLSEKEAAVVRGGRSIASNKIAKVGQGWLAQAIALG